MITEIKIGNTWSIPILSNPIFLKNPDSNNNTEENDPAINVSIIIEFPPSTPNINSRTLKMNPEI